MATQVTPDGQAFSGRPWSDQVVMPTHYLNEDNTQGALIDWTTAAFTVSSLQTSGLSLAWNLASRTVTFSLTGDQVSAIQGDLFRWYLAETVLLNAELYWRQVKIGRVT